MIEQSAARKHYSSAKERFLKDMLSRFLMRELPRMFGSILREKIVDEIIKIINRIKIPKDHIEPGQMLWIAIDKETRPDSPNRRHKPIILTLITAEECRRLSDGEKMKKIAGESIARIMREAYSQGALLSMRDIELFTWRQRGALVHIRQSYEAENNVILPFTGTLQDMGSCITHKDVIVRKVIIEKKDPRLVAKETNHSQKAVDHYVGDYNRVKQVFEKEESEDYISLVTGIAKHVVRQYIKIIKSEKT
jgi:hypothetical protein